MREGITVEGAPPAPVWPGGRFKGSPEQRGLQVNVNFNHSVLSEFGKMTFPECDVRLMASELAATRWRVRELIRVRELCS